MCSSDLHLARVSQVLPFLGFCGHICFLIFNCINSFPPQALLFGPSVYLRPDAVQAPVVKCICPIRIVLIAFVDSPTLWPLRTHVLPPSDFTAHCSCSPPALPPPRDLSPLHIPADSGGLHWNAGSRQENPGLIVIIIIIIIIIYHPAPVAAAPPWPAPHLPSPAP